MTEKFIIPKAWGATYNTAIKEHSGWQCPHCNERACYPEELLDNPHGLYRFVIGFSMEIPFGSMRSGIHRSDNQVIGSFIVECPRCFEKYFIHVTVAEVRRAVEKCPNDQFHLPDLNLRHTGCQ